MGMKISKGADLGEDLEPGQAWGEGMSEAEQSAYDAEPPKVRPENHKITRAMRVFIDGIVEGKSQFHAYRAAYPNAKGADRTIRQNAHRLMKHPGVAFHLSQRQDETAEVLANDANAARLHVIRNLITHSTRQAGRHTPESTRTTREGDRVVYTASADADRGRVSLRPAQAVGISPPDVGACATCATDD